MRKRTFWYAGLTLLCCSAVALVVNAASVDAKKAKKNDRQAVSNFVPSAFEALSSQETSGKIDEVAIRAEIAALETQLHTPTATPMPEPAGLRDQLRALRAQLPENRESANPLDQGGENCAAATLIPSLPYTDNGTTSGYAHDYDAVCPYNNPGAPDVVYRYTPSVNQSLNLDLCASQYDTKMYIYATTCAGTPIACNDDFDGCGTDSWKSRLNAVPVTAGTTYYIVIDGYSSSDFGAYTLNVSAVAPCVINQQGGDVVECAEPANPDSTNMANDCDGGCNNATTPLFQNITCGQTVYGRGFTYVRPSGTQVRDTDWYRFTITQTCTVRVTVRAEFPALFGIVQNIEPCASPVFAASATTAAPCDSNVAVAVCLSPGTYAMFVAPAQFSGVPLGEYRASLFCSAPCAPCTWDLTLNAPGVVSGNTLGAVNNCNLRPSEEQIVRVTIPTSGNWTFSLCDNETWDSYILLGTECCGGIIAQDDDGCPFPRSRILCLNLTAGTYYLMVEGFSTGAGPFTLNVSSCGVCDITQQPGDIVEFAENFADTTFYRTDPNGGCNNDPTPSWQDIQCGQTVFGRTRTYAGPGGAEYRDTDWYRFTVNTTTEVTWRTSSEVAGFGFILNISDCNNVTVIAQGNNTAPCDTAVATALLTPGTYAVWYGPQAFTGVPLVNYRGTLLGDCACDEAEQLTIIRAAYPSNAVNLRWFATQTNGRYQVYRTENKNNDGDPNGGSDPDWSLVATVNAPATPGYQTVSNLPIGSYYNYVVVHDCQPLGRCCYGNPQSPSCATNTETQCNALAGTWSIGQNCTNNPCPIVLQGQDACGPSNPLLTQGQEVSGTTVGATTDGTWPCASGGAEVWYRYTATGTGTATVSTCGNTTYDSAVMVLASCNGTNLACNDDFCGLQSQTTFAATAGVTYWIAVGGFASNTGNYTLVVTQ